MSSVVGSASPFEVPFGPQWVFNRGNKGSELLDVDVTVLAFAQWACHLSLNARSSRCEVVDGPGWVVEMGRADGEVCRGRSRMARFAAILCTLPAPPCARFPGRLVAHCAEVMELKHKSSNSQRSLQADLGSATPC